MKPISYEYLHPTEHRMAHARKNIRCKRPARRAPNVAQNPIICSTCLQSCRSCRPKPSQHAEGYYTEYTMATGRIFSLLWAHQKTKMGPCPKLNLVTRWRDDVNLSMWKINIPNSPEWPTPEKNTCCKGPHSPPQKGTKCGPRAHNA